MPDFYQDDYDISCTCESIGPCGACPVHGSQSKFTTTKSTISREEFVKSTFEQSYYLKETLRERLEKMTKQEIIDYIVESAEELDDE